MFQKLKLIRFLLLTVATVTFGPGIRQVWFSSVSKHLDPRSSEFMAAEPEFLHVCELCRFQWNSTGFTGFLQVSQEL